MVARGFRTDFQVVTMHRPNEAGDIRPRLYLLDDGGKRPAPAISSQLRTISRSLARRGVSCRGFRQ